MTDHVRPFPAPRALYEEVAELLRQRIFSRELEPGSWIDELKLAEEYGISRTPLREALKVLAAEGLVTMKVRRGAYVTEVSDSDLADVYHLLAPAGKRRGRRGGHRGDRRRSWRTARPARRAGSRRPATATAFSRSTKRFHMRLLEIANNRWRDQMVADLRKVMKLNRHNSLLKSGRIEESLAEHRAIMAALVARDAADTAQRMREHFRTGWKPRPERLTASACQASPANRAA